MASDQRSVAVACQGGWSHTALAITAAAAWDALRAEGLEYSPVESAAQ